MLERWTRRPFRTCKKRVQNLGYATDDDSFGRRNGAVTTIVSLVRKPASEKTATPAAKTASPVDPLRTVRRRRRLRPPSTPARGFCPASVTPSVALHPLKPCLPAATESQANNLAPSRFLTRLPTRFLTRLLTRLRNLVEGVDHVFPNSYFCLPFGRTAPACFLFAGA